MKNFRRLGYNRELPQQNEELTSSAGAHNTIQIPTTKIQNSSSKKTMYTLWIQ